MLYVTFWDHFVKYLVNLPTSNNLLSLFVAIINILCGIDIMQNIMQHFSSQNGVGSNPHPKQLSNSLSFTACSPKYDNFKTCPACKPFRSFKSHEYNHDKERYSFLLPLASKANLFSRLASRSN